MQIDETDTDLARGPIGFEAAQPAALAFLNGGGDMGQRIRAFDWSLHPIGPPEFWPQSLRTVLRLMLTTNHPVFVFWGADHICFYNDAYRASIGEEKHPAMLGAKGRDMWGEIWHIIGPQIEMVLGGGGATWHEDHLVPIIRHGQLEDVYWTYGFSPIDDSRFDSGIGGVLVVCTETTQKVFAQRRLKFQLELTEQLRYSDSVEGITAVASEMLGKHLQVGRAGFAKVDDSGEFFEVERDWTDGVMPSLAGRFRLGDFGGEIVREFREGRTVRIEDSTKDPRTLASAEAYESIGSMRAGIAVPLNKDGRFVASIYVQQSTPRRWYEDDEALIRDVAERTWIALDRIRTEDAVRKLHDELESKVAERTSELLAMYEQLHGFTYSVAHDLRSQIRGISANASMVLIDAGTELNAESRENLTRLVDSSRQLASIVDDLLKYARLGRQEPVRISVDLSEVAARVIAQIQSDDLFKAETRIEVEPNLIAVGDPSMLAIVLQNLVDNACKFSQSAPSPNVRLSMDENGFFVEDNGVGFEMAFAEKIFEPFERLHRGMQYAGTGIGLANVRRIIEKHGGKVWAVSTPNQGAKFYFTLPSGPTSSLHS